MSGELLNLAGYALIGAALCLGVYSFILAIGSLGASEALAEYERAWGDWPRLPNDQPSRGE